MSKSILTIILYFYTIIVIYVGGNFMFGWFEKDPEIERVVARLSEQLEKVENWIINDEDGSVKHRIHNIVTTKNAILSPDHVWLPFRWKRIIGRQLRAIYRVDEVDKLNFMYDVIDGKYSYYVSAITKDLLDWLKENATKDQYMIVEKNRRRRGIYIKDPELAMGYKLTFED